MTHTLNNDRTVAVSPDTYWLKIDADTPRGVKVQLLGLGGIATYGNWDGKSRFWQAWCPVPKKPEWMNA